MEEEQKEKQKQSTALSERRQEQSQLLIQGIHKELWEPRLALMKSNQVRIRKTASDPHWNLLLVGIDSLLPDVDPLNALFGPFQTGTNHVVRHVKDCEVHIIRWHPDPKQHVRHLFDVFPQAGASLDPVKKLLFVQADRKLFPDPYRSLTFCTLASCLLGSGLPRDDHFRFQPARM
jgi:transcription antitermination factor NusA-like protein